MWAILRLHQQTKEDACVNPIWVAFSAHLSWQDTDTLLKHKSYKTNLSWQDTDTLLKHKSYKTNLAEWKV